MKLEEIIGLTAGTITAISMLPQLIEIIKEKEAKDVSVSMILLLLAGLSLWICYGFMKKDIPVIGANIFSFLVNASLLFFWVKYRDKK